MFEEPKRTPQQRIDDIITDVVYEKIELVCQSYLNLIQDHHNDSKSAIARRHLRKLLAAGVKRQEMWRQR